MNKIDWASASKPPPESDLFSVICGWVVFAGLVLFFVLEKTGQTERVERVIRRLLGNHTEEGKP
jgi:hypothetical protein